MIQTLVGRNIRRFRLANGLTIEELAFRAQLHPNHLGEVERGRVNPTLANLKKIADGLKTPLPTLFSGATDIATASAAAEKTAVYFSPKREKDLLAFIKTLRNATPKDRKRIIEIAKSVNSKLK
jgi:transcriptional regulator with XRE-family HTH domain